MKKYMKKIFELTKVINCTDYLYELKNRNIISPDDCYKAGYYICEDVRDFHIYRIIKDMDLSYNKCLGNILVEQENISKWDIIEKLGLKYITDERNAINESIKRTKLTMQDVINSVLILDEEHGYENYGVVEYFDLEDALKAINSYGITEFSFDYDKINDLVQEEYEER